jgi:allene oxide cyclase
MNRATFLIAGALALVAPFAASAGERLQLVERALTDTTIDLGAKGDSVGDLLTIANPIYDAANKTKLGSDQGYCVRVVVGKSWECFWTLLLAEGQITVEGPFFDTGDSVMVVTGGTGKYAGARGDMKLHARDAKSTAYDFLYELL